LQDTALEGISQAGMLDIFQWAWAGPGWRRSRRLRGRRHSRIRSALFGSASARHPAPAFRKPREHPAQRRSILPRLCDRALHRCLPSDSRSAHCRPPPIRALQSLQEPRDAGLPPPDRLGKGLSAPRKPGITLASPIFGQDGAVEAMLGIDIEISDISRFLAKNSLLSRKSKYISTPEGKVISHSNASVLLPDSTAGDSALRFRKHV
jgi:hypothetical protein